MNDISLKYELLDKSSKNLVSELMDFLLSRAKSAEQKTHKSYRDRILDVSVWSDEDMKLFNDNQKRYGQWMPKEW